MNPEVFGFAAGILGALSLFPQIQKSWRTKSTKDISLLWTLIHLSGQTLWTTYGYMIQSISLILMSSITWCLTIILIGLKLKYD